MATLRLDRLVARSLVSRSDIEAAYATEKENKAISRGDRSQGIGARKGWQASDGKDCHREKEEGGKTQADTGQNARRSRIASMLT